MEEEKEGWSVERVEGWKDGELVGWTEGGMEVYRRGTQGWRDDETKTEKGQLEET